MLVPLERARSKINSTAFREPSSISVRLLEGLRKPVARDVVSHVDLPPHDRSAMDGYAFSHSDLLRYGKLSVSGELFPSTRHARRLGRGQAAYVATGAPIPLGADVVARVESCKVEGKTLTVHEKVHRGKDIQEKGNDIQRKGVVAKKGELLTPYHVGIFSSIGLTKVSVFRLRIALMAIGDELTTFTKIKPGGTSDSISATIMGLAHFADVNYLGVFADDERSISAALRSAASSADMMVTIGGTSVGKFDFTKKAVGTEGELLFEGVSVNTLKRAAVGMVDGRPVVILPGQVVSAAVSFHEHGLHVVSRMVGRELREYVKVTLAEDMEVQHKMDSVYLFRLQDGAARPLPWGVGLHNTLLKANAFGILRSGTTYEAGSTLVLQKLIT